MLALLDELLEELDELVDEGGWAELPLPLDTVALDATTEVVVDVLLARLLITGAVDTESDMMVLKSV